MLDEGIKKVLIWNCCPVLSHILLYEWCMPSIACQVFLSTIQILSHLIIRALSTAPDYLFKKSQTSKEIKSFQLNLMLFIYVSAQVIHIFSGINQVWEELTLSTTFFFNFYLF